MRSLGFVSLGRGEGQELFEPYGGDKFTAPREFTVGKANVLHLSMGPTFMQCGI